MTRPSDITRERILKAAERLSADRGYEETSIRAIVTKARVNQAAINYHFKGKDGLYREVLRTAFRAGSPRRSTTCSHRRNSSSIWRSIWSRRIGAISILKSGPIRTPKWFERRRRTVSSLAFS